MSFEEERAVCDTMKSGQQCGNFLRTRDMAARLMETILTDSISTSSKWKITSQLQQQEPTFSQHHNQQHLLFLSSNCILASPFQSPTSPIFSESTEQQQSDDSRRSPFRSNKKAVRWVSNTVDNEFMQKKSFNKEYYFSQVFEVNADIYMGITPGSMQMKLVKRT